MLTQNEITALNLSPTKKDFVQIWNELLEVAGKLSERWDPTSTNESDPGIVILKALTGIADKLNYTIDKNTLEAFMPTAAQEDSMRKLCDMLGYNIKYYRSAKTEVTIKWYNPEPTEKEAEIMSLAKGGGVTIPKFTVITNSDQDKSYFTLSSCSLSSDRPSAIVECMEGQVVKCESIHDSNIITSSHITENNRYYLPEVHIAENGIFIYNIYNSEDTLNAGLIDGASWEKVDNLNIQPRGTRAYKFGFDSYEGRPYVEFPEDYSSLFGDGIFIYYTRTNGVNGNVAVRTLTKIELPTSSEWTNLSVDSFSAENLFAATDGADVETIKQAYNNFKKTVGTFEALVTCRDYMNKIYSLMADGQIAGSNILVTDIRNDINRAITICSCDDSGIFYKEVSLVEKDAETVEIDVPVKQKISQEVEITANKPVFDEGNSKWHIGSIDGPELTISVDGFVGNEPGTITITDDKCYGITQNVGGTDTVFNTKLRAKENVSVNANFTTKTEITKDVDAISHFDLVLYPFKKFNQIKSGVKSIRKAYDESFTFTPKTFDSINRILKYYDIKNIAHNTVLPRENDLVSINNYLRLNATIITTSKIAKEECSIVIDNVKKALANAFNMKELDFGEEIPFESIVEVIEGADARIRAISLNEPTLYTTFSVYKGLDNYGVPIVKEYAVESKWLSTKTAKAVPQLDTTSVDKTTLTYTGTFNTVEARNIYNRLAVRNVLAGRVALFNFNTQFSTSFSDSAYQVQQTLDNLPELVTLPSVNAQLPFAICTNGDAIFTAQYYVPSDEEAAAGAESGAKYSKTYTPEDYAANIVTTTADGEVINAIAPECEIAADAAGVISNVELASGEFVKFRAPNFTTSITYPAYVNYNLRLDVSTKSESRAAEAESLFDLLNADATQYSNTEENIRWAQMFNYFSEKNDRTGEPCVRTYTLTQPVSAFSDAGETSSELKGDIIVSVTNKDQAAGELEDLYNALDRGGCLRLSNDKVLDDGNLVGFKAILAWLDDDKNDPPVGMLAPDFGGSDIIIGLDTPYITSASVLDDILANINTAIEELIGMTREVGGEQVPVLPSNCGWTITLKFDCVPFEPTTLEQWQAFLTTEVAKSIFGFAPVRENQNGLWRVLDTSGYSIGKYILADTRKLLKFEANYFTLLPTSVMHGIYICKDLGENAEPVIIKNETEYKLRANEYLFIEYTPSTTTEDGTTQDLEAVTVVHGPGTIIRPTGFEVGIMDSSTLAAAKSITPFKTVTFDTPEKANIDMMRFGANEQVEIRDYAKVTLSKDTFADSPVIYYYKNFNGCDELEQLTTSGSDRINNTYTLKDGEYIFYTDQNQTEFAYFTTGTEVKLDGNVALTQEEIIDISTIFDTGVQAIPWTSYSFTGSDAITFQEFQYVTIGAGDTINSIELCDTGDSEPKLSSDWQYCNNITYAAAGEEKQKTLPAVDTFDSTVGNTGCGWQASSTFELSVAPDSPQTLRNDGVVSTRLALHGVSSSSESTDPYYVAPEPDSTLSFKTNVKCQTGSDFVTFDDIYSNPSGANSFELKIFNTENPTIVRTLPESVAPYRSSLNSLIDINDWHGDTQSIRRAQSSPWYSVDLELLQSNKIDSYSSPYQDKSNRYDNALKLPISLLPNTYGVFCIYLALLDQTTDVWIEVIPGTSQNDISILNADSTATYWETESNQSSSNKADRLYLTSGINCIKVCNTGKIFIKADLSATGVLYFDELKLVNCMAIEYKDPISVTGSTLKTTTTQGLNLHQLGYLSTDIDPVTNIQEFNETNLLLDSEMREDLKVSYTNAARAIIDTKLKEAETAYLDSYRDLYNKKTDIQKQLAFVDKVYEELTKLTAHASDTDSYMQLLSMYKSLETVLTVEKELLEALDENKDIYDQETVLASLVSSFARTSDELQTLLDNLESLKEIMLREISGELADIDILEDFKSTPDDDFAEIDIIDSLKQASFTEIEAIHTAKITKISEKLSSMSDQADQSKVKTSLTALLTANTARIRAMLQLSMNRFSAGRKDTELISLVEQVRTKAYSGDSVVDLRSAVTSLRDRLLKPTSIELVLDALTAELEEGEPDVIEDLLNKLNELNNTVEHVVDSYGFTDLLTSIGTAINTNVAFTDTASVDALCNRVMNQYNNELYTLLQQFTEDLAELQEVYGIYASVLDSLNDTDAAIIEKVQEELTSALDETTTALNTLNSFGKNSAGEDLDAQETLKKLRNYLNQSTDTDGGELPYAEAAVISVWGGVIRAELENATASLYSDTRKCIILLASLDNQPEVPALPERLSKFVSTADFSALLQQLSIMCGRNQSNSVRKQLMSVISTQMPNFNDFTEARDSIGPTASNAAYFTNIYNIVNSITALNSSSTDTTIKKRQYIDRLRTELNNVIKLDSDILGTIANVICPSILKYESIMPEAQEDPAATEKYSRLNEKVLSAKTTLLETEFTSENFSTIINTTAAKFSNSSDAISTLLECFESSQVSNITDFLEDLDIADFATVSLLGDCYKDMLEDISTARRCINVAAASTNTVLLHILGKNNYAVGKDPNWRDKLDRAVTKDNLGRLIDTYGHEITLKYDQEDRTWYFKYDNTWSQVDILDDNDWLLLDGTCIPFDTSDYHTEVKQALIDLLDNVTALSQANEITEEYKAAFSVLKLEQQLLADIRAMDTYNEFYYTAAVEPSIAIDFNEGDDDLNTLMNPALNYDINNINNTFVISKLDIDYLDTGLQIARSSRLS